MTRGLQRLVVPVALLLLSACSTKQVKPVAGLDVKRICIIESPAAVGAGTFAEAYRKALEDRGYQVEVLPETAQPTICPVTTRYAARWNWDGPIRYLAYAELRVYEGGRTIGQARFDARASRFISAEHEIKELVDALFPR
jgi:hypothetical protein